MNSYTTQIQEAEEGYADFKIDIHDNNFIGSNGKLNMLIYSDSSNEVTASLIDVDYIDVQLTISLNPLSVLETSGFSKKEYVDASIEPLATKETVNNVQQTAKTDLNSHITNQQNPHKITKSQIGLGNVPNYAVATEDEAKQGDSDGSFMTPAKTKLVVSEGMSEVGIGITTKSVLLIECAVSGRIFYWMVKHMVRRTATELMTCEFVAKDSTQLMHQLC